MEVLDVMPSVASVRALAPTRVATISNKMLRDVYKMDAGIFSLVIMNLARDLSRRLRRMDELHSQEHQRGASTK
jgi:CRP-like cAMP-binding protein